MRCSCTVGFLAVKARQFSMQFILDRKKLKIKRLLCMEFWSIVLMTRAMEHCDDMVIEHCDDKNSGAL